MTTVNLGSFTQIGGQSVAVGGASGLDTESIINSLVEVEELPKLDLEEQVTTTDSEIDALSALRSKIVALQNAVDILRNPPGVNNEANNIFEYRTPFLTSNTTVSASTYVGITVEPGAELTKFEIEIESIAEFQQSRSSVGVSSKDTNLFASDTTFDIDDENNDLLATIEIQAGDTLENVKDKINAQQGATGISAYILQVSDTDFRLVLESDDTGLSNAFNLDFSADATVDTALGSITTAQAAADASFTIGGLSLTRESNTVSDVLENVTLNLFEPTPDFGGASPTVITAEIVQDTELVVAAVDQFVTAYNDYRTFYAEQTQRDEDGLYLEDSVLAQNNSFTSIVRQLDIEVTNSVEGLLDNYNDLTDLGLTIVDQDATDDQIAVSAVLSLNETILRDALNEDPDAFQQIFEFQLIEDTGKVSVFDRTNSLDVSSFTIDIDKTREADDVALVTYTDPDTGEVIEYFANYTASKDVEFSDDITTTSMFGVSTAEDVFTTDVTDGHSIRLALEDPINGVTNFDFTFQTTITDSNTEFNSLETLATAINSQTGLTASVTDGVLSLSADDGLDTVTISNLDSTDFKGTLGLEDLTVIGGIITMDAKDRAISEDITTTAMFGASDVSTDFSSGITEGDTLVLSLAVTTTDVDGNSVVTTTDHTFTFDTTSPDSASGEFSNLSNLADAINAQTGLNASIYDNKLVISGENDTDTVTISNGSSTDIKGTLGLDDIVAASDNITPLNGLELIYVGDGTDTGSDILNVSITQGIADRFYNTIEEFVVDDGVIDNDVDALTTRKDSLEDDIEALEEHIDDYRLDLLDEYSRLEQAITSANSILLLLAAQDDARNNA